jgi:UDP-GlcNAc:undecaprenyl-phosphate/decaprenyl-phosphate GlcNAc-1-phosphate transferase
MDFMDDLRSWMACLLAAVVTAALLAALRSVAPVLGLMDRPNERKLHGSAVPLVGGLAMLGGIAAGQAVSGQGDPFVGVLLATGLVVALVGALDDRHDLSVGPRLFAQVGCALAVVFATGQDLDAIGPAGGGVLHLGTLGIPVTVLLVVGIQNAFNMIDGMDGLAGTQAMLSLAALVAFHGGASHGEVTMLMAIMGASCLPYLVANLGMPRHKVFLGDAGSMLMGYLLAWTLVRLARADESPLQPADVPWCVALPVLDTLTVMLRRLSEHVSPVKPDRGHVHHVLQDLGFTPRQTLLILMGLASLLALLGLAVSRYAAGAGLTVFAAVSLVYMWATTRGYRRARTMGATSL